MDENAGSSTARDVTVVPIADEAPLYYENWVQGNIDHVAAKTGGKVGYLHIPDMGPEGLNEFVRRFYPQLNREALIIDVRGNGGGNLGLGDHRYLPRVCSGRSPVSSATARDVHCSRQPRGRFNAKAMNAEAWQCCAMR